MLKSSEVSCHDFCHFLLNSKKYHMHFCKDFPVIRITHIYAKCSQMLNLDEGFRGLCLITSIFL